ncbi:MAG: hypothetical protein K8S54_03235 [Spirochaetia bacterium]|nr:hypothetical protein [Spirochaetia bacterium]
MRPLFFYASPLRSTTLLLLPVMLLLAACSGHEKKLQEIQDLIKSGNKAQAEELIRSELTRENKDHARSIDDGDLQMPQSSPGARTAVWVKGETKLVVLRNGKKNELNLDRKIKNIQLAPGGKFALVLGIKDQNCGLVAVNLLEREIVHEIPSCDAGAAITHDGQEILYTAKGGVGRIHLKDGEKTTEDVLLDKGTFQAKFPKLTNRFFIVPDAQNHLYVFYGAAGQYRMNLFVSGQNMTTLKDGIARPQVYFADPEPDILKREIAKADPNPPLGLVFTGSSGKYRLAPVFAERVSDETMPAPTIDPIQMLVSGSVFYLNGDTPALYHPVLGKKNLPLRATEAIVVYGEDPEDQGILYLDHAREMVFRREPFTEWEKTLQSAADKNK